MSQAQTHFMSAATSLHQVIYTCQDTFSSKFHYKYHLYPAQQFCTLLATVRAKKDHDARILQYIVTQEKKLLLAVEGPHGPTIPTHQNMSSPLGVLAAGYLFVDPEKNEIIGINNESQNFKKLSTKTMIWPISILHLMNVPIASNLSVINSKGISFSLSLSNQKRLISSLPFDLFKSLLEANQDKSVTIRESRHHHFDSFFSNYIKENILFNQLDDSKLVQPSVFATTD